MTLSPFSVTNLCRTFASFEGGQVIDVCYKISCLLLVFCTKNKASTSFGYGKTYLSQRSSLSKIYKLKDDFSTKYAAIAIENILDD